MARLSGMDAAFLYLESPTIHLHVTGVIVLDPSDVPGGVGVREIQALVLDRLHLMAPFRHRALMVPFGIDHPVVIDDPDFAIEHHVRGIGVRAPGTMIELAELVGDLASSPLDRSRALWEMWVIDGLADGRVALVTKVHHSLIDGATGADLMAHLLDLEPVPAPADPPTHPWVPAARPSDLQLVAEAALGRLRDPLRLPRAAVRATRSVADLARTLLSGSDPSRPALPFSAPRTIINRPVTARRSVAFGQVPLEDLKAIKARCGTTVNDVVLAACALALRGWLLDHDDLPDRPLVCAVPVSVHGPGGGRSDDVDAEAGGTNLVSNMFVRLPMHTAAPCDVLAEIALDTVDAKRLFRAMGADLLLELAQATPPGVFNLASRFLTATHVVDQLPPVHNLVISNVPGPPVPLFLAGARVSGVYPFGPLLESAGLNITVLSNMGNVDIGVIACPDTVPDLWDLVHGIEAAVAALLAASAEADAAPVDGAAEK